ARRISGELVSADFIHRSGQFRSAETGELLDFTLTPYGSVNYLNAEADLRDVPLGTVFAFFLNQDAKGGFTRLARMKDQVTLDVTGKTSTETQIQATEQQRKKFIEFNKKRGLPGWVDKT